MVSGKKLRFALSQSRSGGMGPPPPPLLDLPLNVRVPTINRNCTSCMCVYHLHPMICIIVTLRKSSKK